MDAKTNIDVIETINQIIKSKEDYIKELEDEIYYLKKTRRMIEDKFKDKINEIPRHIG